MLPDDVGGLLHHLDDPTVSNSELLQYFDLDSCKLASSPLAIDTSSLDGLLSISDTNDHHSAITTSDNASPAESLSDVVNIRTRDAIRRSTYRQKQKAQREALLVQVKELSSQLAMLVTAKAAAQGNMHGTQAMVWKALALRNHQARQKAEEQRAKLHAATERRATLIQDLGHLIRQRVTEEAGRETKYTAKRRHTETPDKMLYTAYLNQLDEIHAKTDSVFLATAGLIDVETCESTPVFHYPLRKLCTDATYRELVGTFTTPFAYDKVRDNLHRVYCLEFRPGFELINDPSLPLDATITKCRLEGFMGSALQQCVMRRYNERDRVVIIWRKFTEGKGMFAGMHMDETGWCIIRPSRVDRSLSSVVELVSRFVPMNFSIAATSDDRVKRFADLLITDNEDIFKLGLQSLEKKLLDDALGMC